MVLHQKKATFKESAGIVIDNSDVLCYPSDMERDKEVKEQPTVFSQDLESILSVQRLHHDSTVKDIRQMSTENTV